MRAKSWLAVSLECSMFFMGLLLHFRLCPYGTKSNAMAIQGQSSQRNYLNIEVLSEGMELGPAEYGHYRTTSGRALRLTPRLQYTDKRNAQDALCLIGEAIHRLCKFATGVQ